MGFVTLALAVLVVILLYLLVNKYSTPGNTAHGKGKKSKKDLSSENKSTEEVEQNLGKKRHYVKQKEAESNSMVATTSANDTPSIPSASAHAPEAVALKSNELSNNWTTAKRTEIISAPTVLKQSSIRGDCETAYPEQTQQSKTCSTMERSDTALRASHSFDRLLNTALPVSETSTTTTTSSRTDHSEVLINRTISNSFADPVHSPNKISEPSTISTVQYYGGNNENIDIQRMKPCDIHIAYSQDMQTLYDNGMPTNTTAENVWQNGVDPH
ncbi:hypothetical protein Tcan_18991 [Toxocara canis]|uniref:Uncharacterized protein n=1 Tax=Toxocara canis TaxID=6265 RepID=A0A0B2VYN3_TOXCA|nr:hypothetical protein Tcan_18991 [Toxocara canis]